MPKVGIIPNRKTWSPKLELYQTWKTWKRVQSWNYTKHEYKSKVGIIPNMKSKVGIIPNMKNMKTSPKLELHQTWETWKRVQSWNYTKHEKHEYKSKVGIIPYMRNMKSKVGIIPNMKNMNTSPKLELYQTWKTWKKDQVRNWNFLQNIEKKIQNIEEKTKSKIGTLFKTLKKRFNTLKKRPSPKLELYSKHWRKDSKHWRKD